MRLSRYFLPVLKETPKEAEIVSHKLMLRAGMIKQQAAGSYSWLPLGFKVLQKVVRIIEEEQDRAGRRRAADADAAIGRSLARIRPLRRLWQGDAADRGPARARDALRPDQRGDDHRHLPHIRQVLQGLAAQSLSRAVEVPRRGAAALRHHAQPRIPDEGRLFVRSRRGRRDAGVLPHVRRLSADVLPHGPRRHADARRHRPDRRQSELRIPRPRRYRRERRVPRQAAWSTSRSRRSTPISAAISRRSSRTGRRCSPRPTR